MGKSSGEASGKKVGEGIRRASVKGMGKVLERGKEGPSEEGELGMGLEVRKFPSFAMSVSSCIPLCRM
jgi:hypothetical protein